MVLPSAFIFMSRYGLLFGFSLQKLMFAGRLIWKLSLIFSLMASLCKPYLWILICCIINCVQKRGLQHQLPFRDFYLHLLPLQIYNFTWKNFTNTSIHKWKSFLLAINSNANLRCWEEVQSRVGQFIDQIVNFAILIILVLLSSMLIDPRPYTYEFRKPRYGNPTFQSRNLYESLYHRYGNQPNDYFIQQERNMYTSAQKLPKAESYSRQEKPLERHASDIKDQRYNQAYYKSSQSPVPLPSNPEKQMEGYKLPSINRNDERPVRMQQEVRDHYLQAPRTQNIQQRKGGFERFRVYERQQKPYNIISCYPKENESNKLRSFPKLTLEDKLIERGSYHDFKTERF